MQAAVFRDWLAKPDERKAAQRQRTIEALRQERTSAPMLTVGAGQNLDTLTAALAEIARRGADNITLGRLRVTQGTA